MSKVCTECGHAYPEMESMIDVAEDCTKCGGKGTVIDDDVEDEEEE